MKDKRLRDEENSFTIVAHQFFDPLAVGQVEWATRRRYVPYRSAQFHPGSF